MATLTDRIAVLIDSRANVSGFTQAASASGRLSASQDGLLSKLNANKGAIIGWGAAAVAAATIVWKGATDAADSYSHLASEVRNVKQATGESADTASRWVAIADDFNIEGSKLGTMFARLGKNIQGGSLDLTQWGAEVVRNKSGAVDMQETILSIADAYKRSNSAAERNELLMKAFGKTGRELIPIMEGGRDAIKEMFSAVPEGQLLSDEDLQAAREYDLAMDDLSDAAQELQYALGEGVAPALTDVARNAADAMREVGPLIDAINSLNPSISQEDLASLFGAGDGSHQLADYYREGTKAAEDQAMAIRDAIAAIKEYDAQTLGAEGTNLRLEQAQLSYTQAVRDHGVASLEARQALYDEKVAVDAKVQSLIKAGASEKEQYDTLMFLKTLYPELGGVIDGYVATLGLVPKDVHTQVTVDWGQANSDIDDLIRKIDSVPRQVVVQFLATEAHGSGTVGQKK